jgi:ABC-type transport system involved in cytochrome c biogenesis permease subunit
MAWPEFLFLVLIPLGIVTGVSGITAWAAPKLRLLSGVALVLGFLQLVLTIAAWAGRTAAAGHLPLFGTYESALSLALAVTLAGALFDLRRREARILPWACLVSSLLLAHGAAYSREIYALTISERSWVVDVHAVAAWAAFGVLALNAGVALRMIIQRKAKTDTPNSWLAGTLSLGFLLHTALLATGALYKFLLFGKAWSFDPIETLGFAAWIAYGTLLHMHLLAGWNGWRLAAWCLGLFLILVVSYRGIVYFPSWSTYHIFDMDLRIHLVGDEP